MNYGQPTAPPPYDTGAPYPIYGNQPAPPGFQGQYNPPGPGYPPQGYPPQGYPPQGYAPQQMYLPPGAGQYGSAKVVHQQPAPVIVMHEQPRGSSSRTQSLAKDCCLIALCLSLCCCCMDCCD